MTGRMRHTRWRTLVLIVALATPGFESGRGDELPFVRVIVPSTAVRDVPRGEGRFIPLPLSEFDEAVARLGGGSTLRRPGASSARYTLAVDGARGLEGTIDFTIDGAAGAIPAELPLGRVSVGRCTIRTPEGSGEAVVYGLSDGRVAVRTAGPGTYSASIRVPAAAVGRRFVMPLVPSLMTTVDVTLPGTLRPFVVGPVASSVAVQDMGEGHWRILMGPIEDLPIVIRDTSTARPAITAWNAVSLRGRQADVISRIDPVGTWGPGDIELTVDRSLRIARVIADGVGDIPWRLVETALMIDMPPSLVGSSSSLVITAVTPRPSDGPWTVVMIRPLPDQWAGGGTRLVVDPALAVGGIDLEQCLVVSEDASADWPLPSTERRRRERGAVMGPPPARLSLEHQGAAARAQVTVGPRTPVFDTARVTTVDISPGTVLGRANCDVQVVSGEAFEIVADIAPGWIIDSVEPVDFTAGTPGELTDSETGQLDWRVVRTQRSNELRIGLARAATPQRSLGLRIAGHRVGLPLGAEFTTTELDMVRLTGESSATALLEFRVGPTAVVEVGGTAMGLEPADGRLAPLTGDSPPRARIRTGERSPSVRARLVRRRPPVAADVQLALTAREERLAQAFTFTCRPVAGELDALVIHFSEPLGTGLEWSLVDPPGGTLVARPLATRSGSANSVEEAAALGLSAGDQAAAAGIAESWLVELRPATTSSVTIRASRTVPLEAAVPVPLAWVEAAEQPGGIVAVRGGRGRRPEIVNRRLRELPPIADGDDTALVELAYGSPESVASGDGFPPADILPPAAAAGARAWAWRESTRVWCHASGELEWETTIDLENQGRDEVALSVPSGLSLESVEVAAARIAVEPVSGREGVSVPLPLPSRRGRVTLTLSGSARRDAKLGWWTVGGIACGIDVPVLDREVRLFLPPGLDLAGQPDFGEAPPGWSERLFRGASSARPDAATSRGGFRAVPITSATRGSVADVVVVRRDVIVSLSILAAVVALFGSFLVAGCSGLAAVTCCVIAAGAALWCEPPWYAVPRAAWWGCVAGTWLAGCRLRRAAAAPVILVACAVLGSGSPAHAQESVSQPQADTMPLRVFVTPDADGGTALVPEQLFRRLTAATSGLPPMRVMATDITIEPAGGRCSITLDLDADRGGSLVLDQRLCGATWLTDLHEASPGMMLTYAAGDSEARLTATAAGRHRVNLMCRPGTARQGGVAIASVCLPAAARSTVHIGGLERPGEMSAGWQCERASGDAAWVPATRSGPASFDVAGASRFRIVRPMDSRDRLASEFRTAVSFNDIDWLPSECRVTATFDVGGEREIVRSLVVQADPDLEPVAVADEPSPQSLGGGRWLLERPQARAGQARFSVTFRRRLSEPVGVFEPPGVWLEGVASDARTVRLRPATTLDATVELPLGMTLVRPKLEDGPTTAAVWRQDVATASGESNAAARHQAARITVRRRLVKPRGSQDVVVQFEEDAVSLRLRCQFEATALPLVEIPIELPPAAVIDRVAIVHESTSEDGAERPEGLDVAWSRVAADRIVVMVQRPRIGRFRFELDARLPMRPLNRGRVPLARVVTASDLPLSLTCLATPPLSVTLVGEPGEVMPFLADRFDVAPGEPAPEYELERETATELEWSPEPAEGLAVSADRAGVDVTLVDLAIDRRGRCRGVVRFDLVAPQQVLTLRLPPGMRLFDVRVDGREVTATPREGAAWNVRLHDVSWPRTVVAVISGVVGGRFADGEPIRLEPPRIDGLEGGLVLWSLETPSGFRVRVLPPNRVLSETEWRDRLSEGQVRQGEAFSAAIASVADGDIDRLRSFAAARREGTPPSGEQAWYEAWKGPREAEQVLTRVVAGDKGSLTLRAVPDVPQSVASRGLATAVLVAVALAGWQFARRLPGVWRFVLPLVHRWWWVACGIAWILLLDPALPGWCLLVFGSWFAWPNSWRWKPVHDDASEVSAGASTRTVMPT